MAKMYKMPQKIAVFLLIVFLSVACKQSVDQVPQAFTEVSQPENSSIEQAFKQRKSNLQVEGWGEVVKLLPDDNKGARHQKFLVNISPEQTLLFAHNIDLAPRIENLQTGDAITFKGEYVYNPKGGVMHWTHHDPDGNQQGGWIKHNGKIYE